MSWYFDAKLVVVTVIRRNARSCCSSGNYHAKVATTETGIETSSL